jgi:hypothetical protein
MIDIECREEALEYPMESLGKEIEEKGCRCEAKGEAAFDISRIVPLEGKEVLVILGNRDYSEGVLNVPFDDCATEASLYDLFVYVIDCHVFDS